MNDPFRPLGSGALFGTQCGVLYMTDIFSAQQTSLQSLASAIPSVPHDDAEYLEIPSRALNEAFSWIVRAITVAEDAASMFNAAGSVVPIRLRRAWATGKSTTNIMELFQ
ncbi:hypothetical protein [uncultured Tateyamaria sp.]|uniref:spike base protein, RCAP_Rcc01079 family n=1 Tax=uncultured Tateyamaria sp. TaxID=455651 RepID=UPI002616F368|nr:hypothetical protein [uncultured Tateyamaria sp.]